MTKILTGKSLRAEILVDDAPAIDKYLNEAQDTKGSHGKSLKQGDLAKAFGIELVNGNKLHSEGKYRELVDALNNSKKVVVFDHTTRAHLRNAEVSNQKLRAALQRTNHVGIDEVHMAATSQTSAVIGGNVSAPKAELVRKIDKLLNDIGFNAKTFESSAKKTGNKGLGELGKGFKVEDYRGKELSGSKMTELNNASTKKIMLLDGEIKLNHAARESLKQYKAGEISSVLRTLYSKTGRAGEYSSYFVKNGLVYPVDMLGKIQFEQISNDIVGQITAVRKHGADPYTSVRVNHTSMQTSMSAMYAGNNGAHIVGASGTIAGIESLMQSKIGSSSRHISTSMLDIQTMIKNTGGKVLSMSKADLAKADKAVIDTLVNKKNWDAMVFEADPVKQLELVDKYMTDLKRRGVNDAIISVISAEGTGFYVKKGTGQALAKSKDFKKLLESAEVKSKNVTVHEGWKVNKGKYDYIEIKDGVQVLVQAHKAKADKVTGENTGKVFMKNRQISIFNEQGAVGKNFQNDAILVVRGAEKMSADLLTQTILRSGRPHTKGAWKTERYLAVKDNVLKNANENIQKRSPEIRSLLESITGKDNKMNATNSEIIRLLAKGSNRSLAEQLKLNAEFRQLDLVGDSTRFAVQDTFRDRMVINPLKEAMNGKNKESRAYKIFDKALSDVLNQHGSSADLKLRMAGKESAKTLNDNYVKNNFSSNLNDAAQVWRNVRKNAWRSRNMSLKTWMQATKKLGEIKSAQRALQKNEMPVRTEVNTFAEATTFEELYVVGKRLMEKVLSKETGGSAIGELQHQSSRVAKAAKESKVDSKVSEAFEKSWNETHKQLEWSARDNKTSSSQMTLAQAAKYLHTDEATAKLALANTAADAIQMIHNADYTSQLSGVSDGVMFNTEGIATPENVSVSDVEVPSFNDSRIGSVLKSVPGLGGNLDIKAAEINRTMGAINETTRLWNAGTDESFVAAQQANFGENWMEPALQNKYGSDIAFVRNYSKTNNPLKQAWMIWNQPNQAKGLLNQSLQNIANVNPKLQELKANSDATLTYQGRTMKLNQATQYVQQQLAQAQSLAERYGLDISQQLAGLPARQRIVERQSDAVQSAVESQLRHRQFQSVQKGVQTWQNVVRNFNRMDFVVPMTKAAQGVIQPNMITRMAMGTLFVGMMSVTSLPVTTLMMGVFGGMIFMPLVSRMTKNTDAQKAPSSPLMKWAMPIGLLIVGLFGNPTIATAGVGTLYNQVTEKVFNVSEVGENQVMVNIPTESKGEKRADISGKPVTRAGKSLVDAFKSEMEKAKTKDGKTGFAVLQRLMAEDRFGNVRLKAGAWAQNYGYMHLIAAIFSMVPQALESVSEIDLASEGEQVAEDALTQTGMKIRVTRNSLNLMNKNASEAVLNQVLMAVIQNVFTTAETSILQGKLAQHPEFKEYGSFGLAEFLKQFIFDGQVLQNRIQGESWVVLGGENFYSLIKNRLGREVRSNEVNELDLAMGELENEAMPKMRAMANEIKKLAGHELIAKQEEFQGRFGVDYIDYLAMANPSLAEKILLLFAGKEIFQDKNPLEKIKRHGTQIMGMGVALITAAAIVGIVGTMVVGVPVMFIIGIPAVLLIIAGGLMRWQIAEQVAFRINPTMTVRKQIQTAGFGTGDQAQNEKAHNAGLHTLALLDDPKFNKALQNLKIRGTQRMISEHNRSRAIQSILSHLVRIMESDLKDKTKLQLTQEVIRVLGFLGFDIKMQDHHYKDALVVTLTPETEPKMLQQDYKLGRIIQRLGELGIKLNMRNLGPIKQRKLKVTGAAA